MVKGITPNKLKTPKNMAVPTKKIIYTSSLPPKCAWVFAKIKSEITAITK